ncbi:alpha/beta fold hydrolase [Nocardiopsis sp. RSe5-2]|uniref:Alpha/beta fold hydrolase n=1 Tax=Nocardiopsis endophytica TaxID=3018445 RepID=A0ABT4U5A7_9ACTN|nr:alpha/beta fold hydrolase [Nocardiopsis endophytica]MDA2811896.1 alpha/beta fold hydrolase [Nocardiopsis endophytica]
MRPVEVKVRGLTLSGLLAEPREGPPRAVIAALHGGGMRAGYFHGRADPATSLLTLAAATGAAVLALDRPGYGASAEQLPEGMEQAEQAETVREALAEHARRRPVGDGFLLLGHSLGGKVALAAAAGWKGAGLLGVDVSGISDRWAVDPAGLTEKERAQTHGRVWGPPSLYPPGTFRFARGLVAPVPEREAAQIPHWPRMYARLAPAVRVPVRFTFAEYERWWRSDPVTVEAMASRLGTRAVRVEHMPGAGHNISLGLMARSYHLRVLAFLEECLVRSAAAVSSPPGTTIRESA